MPRGAVNIKPQRASEKFSKHSLEYFRFCFFSPRFCALLLLNGRCLLRSKMCFNGYTSPLSRRPSALPATLHHDEIPQSEIHRIKTLSSMRIRSSGKPTWSFLWMYPRLSLTYRHLGGDTVFSTGQRFSLKTRPGAASPPRSTRATWYPGTQASRLNKSSI